MTTLPPLATCSYKAFKPEMGVAVRTSVGFHRFFRYPAEECKLLAPYGVFKNPAYPRLAQQIEAYHARLDAHVAAIPNDLEIIARRALSSLRSGGPAALPGLPTLVLLCYEDVHAGQECHRRWAADWFKSRMGIDVPEVSPAPQVRASLFGDQ